MAELPEKEQAGASFDMLYTLAKKMEAHRPMHAHRGKQGSSDAYRDKYRRYPTPMGWVATLTEEDLLLPDPEPLDPGVPARYHWGPDSKNDTGNEPLPA